MQRRLSIVQSLLLATLATRPRQEAAGKTSRSRLQPWGAAMRQDLPGIQNLNILLGPQSESCRGESSGSERVRQGETGREADGEQFAVSVSWKLAQHLSR